MEALNRPAALLHRPPHEPDLELDELAHEVIVAASKVHRTLGPDGPAPAYEEALAVQLERRGIPFERGAPLVVGRHLVVALAPATEAAILSHLKAGRFMLGLRLDFHAPVFKDGLRRVSLS